MSSETWPASGSMRSGAVYLREPLEPPTDGRGFLYWPTPDTVNISDGTPFDIQMQRLLERRARVYEAAKKGLMKAGGGRAMTLQMAVQGMMSGQWATPTAQQVNEDESIESFAARRERMKARHGNGNGMGMPLGLQAQIWPTPVAHDAKGGKTPAQIDAMRKSTGAGVSNLNEVTAQWHTPLACDARGSAGRDSKELPNQAMLFSPQDQVISDGAPSSPAAPTSRRRLNPAFACWLMGWPWWWTRIEAISFAAQEMESYRFRLRLLLYYLTGDSTNE